MLPSRAVPGIHRLEPWSLSVLESGRSRILDAHPNAVVQTGGPIRVPGEGSYDVLVYTGPVLKVEVVPAAGSHGATGRHLHAKA